MWLPWDQRVIYFITMCVKDRKYVLARPDVFAEIEKFCRHNPNWNTIAAVVMPDHVHALVSPKRNRDARVTQYAAGLKRTVRRNAASWEWQQGVFDRLLRRDEAALGKWIYGRENPVRAGLVAQWEDWPYLVGYDESNSPAA
jgi:REP element-mobilizing transposase RayT